MSGVGRDQRGEVDAVRAAPPVDLRTDERAIGDAGRHGDANRPQDEQARRQRPWHGAQHVARLGSQRQGWPDRPARPQPSGDQHRQDHHRIGQAAQADAHSAEAQLRTARDDDPQRHRRHGDNGDFQPAYPPAGHGPAWKRHEGHGPGAQMEHPDEHAVNRVVRIAQRGPPEREAEAEAGPWPVGALGAEKEPGEDRQRRRDDQAEVGLATRDERGSEPEGQPRQPRGKGRAGDAPRQHECGVAGQRVKCEIEEVEGRDHADDRNQRNGQQVGEDRVVVLAEVGAAVEREDGGGAQRKRPLVHQFMSKRPEVPDVDAGIV